MNSQKVFWIILNTYFPLGCTWLHYEFENRTFINSFFVSPLAVSINTEANGCETSAGRASNRLNLWLEIPKHEIITNSKH